MSKREYVVCKVGEMQSGERRIIDCDGRSVGVFFVNGSYYALHNRCPHDAASLCMGPLTGTTEFTTGETFIYKDAGYVLRCGWHGWEFDIRNGQAYVDPKMKAKTFSVVVHDDEVKVQIG